jgi:hypothetical protein
MQDLHGLGQHVRARRFPKWGAFGCYLGMEKIQEINPSPEFIAEQRG